MSDPYERFGRTVPVSAAVSQRFLGEKLAQLIGDANREWGGDFESGGYYRYLEWLYHLGRAVRDRLEMVWEALDEGGVPGKILDELKSGKETATGFPLHRLPEQRTAEDLLARGRKMQVLVGVGGTGKSTAMAWMALNAVLSPFSNGRPAPRVKWVTAKDVERLGNAKFGSDATRYRMLRRAPWLLIDELGTESTREDGKLEDLLQDRYHLGKRYVTLATSNLTPKMMADKDIGYGPRLIQRFMEIGESVPFTHVVRPDGQLLGG